MSQTPMSNAAQRRLRVVGIGLTVLTALTFAVVTAVLYVANLGQDFGGALGQGALWGLGAAVISAIIYTLYKNVVVKA